VGQEIDERFVSQSRSPLHSDRLFALTTPHSRLPTPDKDRLTHFPIQPLIVLNREIHRSATVTQLLSNAIEVFVSYAPQDESLRDALGTHLSLLKREGVIADWCDRQISAGSDRASEIRDRLNAAQLILLLISPDFLASDDLWNVVEQSMAQHNAGTTRVIPIRLRPVDCQNAPFAKLQSLPHNGTPITRWENRDEAFLHITQALRTLIASLKSPSAAPAPSASPPPLPTPHSRSAERSRRSPLPFG